MHDTLQKGGVISVSRSDDIRYKGEFTRGTNLFGECIIAVTHAVKKQTPNNSEYVTSGKRNKFIVA